jgi:hypothetical protein
MGDKMSKNHATSIIENKLDISYEKADKLIDPENGDVIDEWAESAVFLVTRCCEVNHDHIELDKKQAMLLAEWLVAFANGEYDE